MDHHTDSAEFQSSPIEVMTSPQPVESDTRDHKDTPACHVAYELDGQLEMAEALGSRRLVVPVRRMRL
jgi:hypothetical protein